MKKRICTLLLSMALLLPLGIHASAAASVVIAPSCLLAEADGSLVIADLYHRALWRRDPAGNYTRLAGREGTRDVNGLPMGGYNDDTAAQAAFQSPWAVAPYAGSYVISDTNNHVLRLLSGGTVGTLAGTGAPGYRNGTGVAAAFDTPTGLATGPDGCLYLADTGNHAIRKIDLQGNVTTLLGGEEGYADGSYTAARLSEPTALCWSGGTLYIADSGNNRLCKLENGVLTTLAGAGPEGDGFVDGPAAQARFSHPQGLAVDGPALYVADTGNGAVRVLADGQVSTLIKTGEGVGGLYPVSPRGLALSGGVLYVGDVFSRMLFTLTPQLPTPAFTDVPPGAWYAPAVSAVQRAGLMSGTGNDRFSPDAPMDRGMAVALLARLERLQNPGAQITGSAAFADVPADAYYADAAAWAGSQALVVGVDGQLFPGRTLTRGELLTFLYRFDGRTGGSAPAADQLGSFSDSGDIPPWAREPLNWAVANGLVTGQPGDRLAPLAPVTRAEVATLLQRYLAQ